MFTVPNKPNKCYMEVGHMSYQDAKYTCARLGAELSQPSYRVSHFKM